MTKIKNDMDIFKLQVHPAAAIFPLLPEDELNELSEDIKAHGLQQPIVVKDGLLIDGRNRREACRRVGVTPDVEELNGINPTAYILSANINRRHLSKGQRAMAVAMLYPEAEQLRRKGSSPIKIIGLVSDQYVSHARAVLKWSPPLAEQVIAGVRALHDAYEEVQQLKRQSDSEPARLDRLRQAARDLADAVIDGEKSLIEAEAELGRRLIARRNTFVAARGIFDKLISASEIFAGEGLQQMANALTDEESPLQKEKAIELIDAWLEKFTELKRRLYEK